MIPTQKLVSIDEIFKEFSESNTRYVFRGQCNSTWPISSSIEREFSKNPDLISLDPKEYEQHTLNKYKTHAHHVMNDSQIPQNMLDWFILMQHHGTPTRLIDFTYSPFIALFFAFNNANSGAEYASVWKIDYRLLINVAIENIKLDFSFTKHMEYRLVIDEVFEKCIINDKHTLIFPVFPKKSNKRIFQQKGLFLCSGDSKKRFMELFDLYIKANSGCELIKRYDVPLTLTKKIITLLNTMNIDNQSLFGDLDGFGNDVKNDLFKYEAAS